MAFKDFCSSCLRFPRNKEHFTEGTSISPVAEPQTSKSDLSLLQSSPGSSTALPVSSPESPKNRALIVAAKGKYDILDDISFPRIEKDEEIIIRSRAVGLNPIDWKSVDYNFCLPSFPWVTGREVSGIVERIGDAVKDFKVGDRVWASTYYRDRRAGCFQQYVVVPQHTVSHIPLNLGFEAAACLGVPALTAAMTLWRWLDVPMNNLSQPPPTSKPAQRILIWGGSTITGQFAIQLAIQSGLTVITITSSKTAPVARRLGAQHVIARDGRSPDEIVSAIREITGDDLTLAIDVVGSATAASCLAALSKSQPAVLAPLAFLKEGQVVPENITIANVEMKQFILDKGMRVHAVELNKLLKEGKVVVPELEVLEGGLKGIEGGLEMLKKGDMGGKKLIIRIE